MINFELINMNARLYDPILGRFLSPDPYIQDPYNFLNYNRYMYGLNNPFSYTDENGEFLHFLIGALIGGIVNWATHGFKFNAKGLGYFATGAAAGALGAGIGMGITATFASSTSFGAGFMGTQSAMNAISQSFSTSFLSGASIGGGAGFASGFVSGVGNGLVEGKSFGKSLVNGFRDGIIGGASGALIGGIAGGISSVRDGRDFWHGGRVIEDVSMDLPQYYQVGELDCRYETFRSFDEYYNGETTPVEELRKLYPNAEIDHVNGTKMYASRRLALLENFDTKKGKLGIASDIAKRMSANRGVIYEKNIGRMLTPKGYRNFGHAMGITRVRIYNNGKILINLMNPDKSGSTAIRSIKNIHRLITVIKF